MQRSIVGFQCDDVGDWVARLACGHGQHVRHKPPFTNHPWVDTDEGRTAHVGTALECPLCDRFELPSHAVAYQRTRDFEAHSVPAGLLADHATKPGVWGVIHVVAGSLRYIVDAPLARELVLDTAHPGIVVPEVRHRVVVGAGVRFFVEFHR